MRARARRGNTARVDQARICRSEMADPRRREVTHSHAHTRAGRRPAALATRTGAMPEPRRRREVYEQYICGVSPERACREREYRATRRARHGSREAARNMQSAAARSARGVSRAEGESARPEGGARQTRAQRRLHFTFAVSPPPPLPPTRRTNQA